MMDALIVDDSPTMLLRLRRILETDGTVTLTTSRDPVAALLEARTRSFDIVLIDYHMPEMDGLTFIAAMRAIPFYAQVPIVMITSDVCDKTRLAALEAGATDFLDKRTGGVELKVRLHNLVRLANAVRKLDDQVALLAGEVETATRHLREREAEIIFRLSLAVEYRDNDTGAHTWRVARYSEVIAEGLGLPHEFCRRLYLAAPLHDVGKVAVPDGILLKKGSLTPDEFAVVRTHTEIGRRILEGSASELIQMGAEIAESHHEKWDGTGYPNGLAGEAIPLSARILAVADVFDALTTQRPYKAAMPLDEARSAIAEQRGRHFDPACVDAFMECWDDVVRIAAMTTSHNSTFTVVTEPWLRIPELPREVARQVA
jgi:putative two-component system response regulator